MAVHNEIRYIRTSVDSILAQTYPDFQFLIVDDASTDNTPDIIGGYNDERIKLVRLKKNIGQTAALNVGLRQIRTPWVARMDADDYSAPERLEEQMNALGNDPTLKVVGTWGWTFGERIDEPQGEVIMPLDYPSIKRLLLRGSSIIHGTIVANTQALQQIGAYDERYRFAADVEMYDRLLADHKAINLPKKLVGIRYHANQATRSNAALDEIMDIQERRLESGRYQAEELKVVRTSLSRMHVVLGRQYGGKWSFFHLVTELFTACRLSPLTFFWHLPVIFLGYFVPERSRTQIRQTLSRIFSFTKLNSRPTEASANI